MNYELRNTAISAETDSTCPSDIGYNWEYYDKNWHQVAGLTLNCSASISSKTKEPEIFQNFIQLFPKDQITEIKPKRPYI